MPHAYSSQSFRNLWKIFAAISVATIIVDLVIEGLIPDNDMSPDMEQTGTMIGFLVVVLPLLVTQVVLFFVLLYRLWSIVPTADARTTPGAAVGLWFIPFFN